MVSQLTLQGYNGAPAIYSLAYDTAPTGYPNLSSLTQPDATQYTFSGNLSKIRYPTGGTVVYDYDYFTFAPQDSYCSIPVAYAVVKRTVSDGATTRVWDYVQQVGRLVPVTTQLYPPCTDDGSIYGPIYWARTSVVAPLDATNQRGRIDHYFSVFADNLGGSTSGFTVNNPLPGQGTQKYGHPGAIGVPPLDARRHRTVPFYNADIDARDTTDSASRLLATETYANCDINGDCTAANLVRSTYELYTGDVFPRTQGEHGLDDTRLLSSRTVFNDDSSCGTQQSPQLCYTQVTNSDDNGAMQFRTSEVTSNFPGAQTVSTTTQFPQWSASDLTNRAWLLSTFTDKTKSENGVTAREQFCFDDTTGILKRHRVLGGTAPLPNDVVQVFTTDSHGDIQFVSDVGADVQASIGQEASLCSASLPSTAWYKVENSYLSLGHYTGGVLASSRYYDRDTSLPLNIFSVDRDVDYSTGVITAARDTSGLQTSYGYTPKPARLESVTASNGVVTNYTYTDATGSADGTWTPAKVQAIATSGTQSMNTLYFFDGLGRNMRTATLGPQNVWSATETKYDEGGHVASKSASESTGTNPPTGPLTAAHKTEYVSDVFGRPVTITTPDGKITSMAYNGVRLRSSTASVATATLESAVTKTEEYDHSGRLRSVTEAVGLPNQLKTFYTYDVSDHLTSVSSSAGAQTRTFTYSDRRGFLGSETHPELGVNGNGSVNYRDYDAHGLAGRKTTGADGGLNDLILKYDSMGRVTDVYDHDSVLHPLKHFVFDNSASASDYRRGKLIEATRYNHPSIGDVLVTESYSYANTLSRPSKRDTVVAMGNGTVVQSYTQNFTYDAFGALGQIDYPDCAGNAACGGAPTGAVTYTRDKGLLTGVTNYASSITYNPDNTVLAITHATTSPVIDTYTPDSSGMTRPGMITFTGFSSCSASATVSGGGSITAGSGQTASVSVAFAGTSPWTITWSDNITQSNITQNPFTRLVSPTVTTTYTASSVVDGIGCSGSTGGAAAVTVQNCNASATVSGGGSINIGQSAQIQAALTGTSPWTVTWSDGISQSGITQNPYVRTVTPGMTTNYMVTNVTDATGCSGTKSGTATVTVTGLAAPTALAATTITGNWLSVNISWNPVQGAAWYQVERATRITLNDWQAVNGHVTGTATTNTFGATPNPITYLYRVRSGVTTGATDYPSPPSALDYATVATTLFTSDPLQAGVTMISGSHMGELRHAIDAVRYAAGYNTPVWSSYAPATGPILAADNITARQRLDDAVYILVNHGVFYSGETPALNGRIWAYQYQQIREGVK